MELTEDDIPGAKLDEPLEQHNNHALRCCSHGITPRHSLTKKELVGR